ncbi:DUF5946 family protein [Paenibacillus sp. 1P03SA]|uniref:DUF5946 family protein n=1 Tax=Paenibacillus sp. 1P03SA TaxID=3132294 RepID=UPI0039A31695
MGENGAVTESGRCMECGAAGIDGFSCWELFGFPLVWEHHDPELYALHFWLVSCYMIQHPSRFTEEGYRHLVRLFIDAYDQDWKTAYILKRNRELMKNIRKLTTALPDQDLKRKPALWSLTIEDIYLGGEQHAIANILRWKERLRHELS